MWCEWLTLRLQKNFLNRPWNRWRYLSSNIEEDKLGQHNPNSSVYWMNRALIIDGSGRFHSCIRLSFGLMICILDFHNHILHDIHQHSDIIIWIQDLIATVPGTVMPGQSRSCWWQRLRSQIWPILLASSFCNQVSSELLLTDKKACIFLSVSTS